MRLALLCALALIVCAPAAAQTRAQTIAATLAPRDGQAVINGGVIVAANGRVTYAGAFGEADFATHAPMRRDAVFQTASMAKPFTSTAILQLRDSGALGLDDQVSQYLPGFPYETITIHNLLQHTSGLPDLELFEAMIAANADHVVTGVDLVPALRAWGQPPRFEPGTAFRYSNINYQLLAEIVAAVSHQSFGAYVRDHIFRPAGMRHSYVLGTSPLARTRAPLANYMYATAYDDALTDVRNVRTGDARQMRRLRYETVNLGSTVGDQNLFTSMDDLVRFDAALRSNRILSAASQAEAYAPVRFNDGTIYSEEPVYVLYSAQCSYGMGWEVCVHPRYGRLVGHAGFNRGIATIFYRNLDRAQAMVMFDNASSFDFNEKFAAVTAIANGDAPSPFPTQRSLTRAYGHALVAEGPAPALALFNLHRADAEHWIFTPRGLNQLGYDLLRNGHADLALEPFQLNITLNPDSGPYYDSYGEGLAANGRTAEAIAAYRRSLELEPNNESGRAALQRLEAQAH